MTTASIALVTIGLLSSAVAYSQVTYDSFIPERVQFNEFPSRLVGRNMQPQALTAGELKSLNPMIICWPIIRLEQTRYRFVHDLLPRTKRAVRCTHLRCVYLVGLSIVDDKVQH